MCPFKVSSWIRYTYLIVDFKLGYVLVLGMPTLDSDWSIQYIPPATVGHLFPCLIPGRWLWRKPSAFLLGYGVPAPPRLQLLRRWGNLNIKNQPISFAVKDFNIISSKWYEFSKGNYLLNPLFVQIALASQTWHMHLTCSIADHLIKKFILIGWKSSGIQTVGHISMSFCRFWETMGIIYSVKQFMRLGSRSWSCFLFYHLGCAPNGLLG